MAKKPTKKVKAKKTAKKTKAKKAKKARKKAGSSLMRMERAPKWRVVCRTDGTLGTFTNYSDAVAAKSNHNNGHQVKIIGEQ